MYCGSCLHDNTLARALRRLGVDVQLIPTYTPLRTDEEDISVDRLFLGGINVFLDQVCPLCRYLPSSVRRLLDRPGLIRWAMSRPRATSARFLGALTVSMLRGSHGRQRREVNRLCDWMSHALRPHLVLFSNILIAGCAPRLRRELGVPLLVCLQGDDAFIEALPEAYKAQAVAQIRQLTASIDGFLVHSRYYAEFMGSYFGIPAEKFALVPLGIDTAGFPPPPADDEPGVDSAKARRPARTIGYLARLAPEKGLHVLVDAFLDLRRREGHGDLCLGIAGWLGAEHRAYAAAAFDKLRAAGLGHAFRYWGSVDRQGKLDFLRTIDILSVPTTYRDPKGLFVLEALAAGVPVVQPAHGAFPELLETLGGGRLVPPNDPTRLADALQELLRDEPRRRQLGRQGAQAVHARFHAQAMAQATWDACQRFLKPPGGPAPGSLEFRSGSR